MRRLELTVELSEEDEAALANLLAELQHPDGGPVDAEDLAEMLLGQLAYAEAMPSSWAAQHLLPILRGMGVLRGS
jgi:hypothetical protein